MVELYLLLMFLLGIGTIVFWFFILFSYLKCWVEGYRKRKKEPKIKKIKKIKGVRPDPAMTKKIKSGQVPYGYKPAQPENVGGVPQVRYVPCRLCPGMAIVKGRLEAKNGWSGLACYCENCKQWTEGDLSQKDREEDWITGGKRQAALHREIEKARKRKGKCRKNVLSVMPESTVEMGK